MRYLEPLCKRCFCGVVEKRIRKYTRLSKAFGKNDNVLITDWLCDFVVKRIIEELEAGDIKYYLFVRPPAQLKPEFKKRY